MKVTHYTDKRGNIHVCETIESAEDVTQEILDIAQDVEEGWFGDEPKIDWESFLDRMDGTTLASGFELDLGNDADSPAIRKIKAHIRELRSMG